MSRPVTAVADQLVRSDVRMVQWVADLYFNGVRVEAGLPIMAPNLSWDGNSQVVGSGNVEVVWADKWGRSRAPQSIGDWMSPFGSELQIDVILMAGSFQERIPIGRYVITSLPTIQDKVIPWRRDSTTRDQLVSATTLTVEVRDSLHKVGRNRFATPESPVSTSVWSEVQRLTGLPLLRTTNDAVVTSGVVYADSRLDTLDSLFDLMQAWPHMTSTGAIAARPYAWPTPVDVVLRPSSLVSSMDSENIYNHVVVEGKDAAGNPVRAQASINEGPLRAREGNGAIAPYGPATYFYTSDFINTTQQAQRTADRLLSEVSQRRGVIVGWDEPFNPLREVGDVVWLGPALVRIVTVGTDGTATTCTAEVAQ